jgi:hypothetical protein
LSASFTTRLTKLIQAWTMVENIIYAVFYVLAILLFIGYAIYTAAHHVKF